MRCEKSQDSDGFTFVTYKRKRKRINLKQVKPPPTKAKLEVVDAFEKSKIDSIQQNLKCSEFFENFKESLKCILSNWDVQLAAHQQKDILNTLAESISNLAIDDSDKLDIVCYGLGHFTSCMISRYQLVFLLALKEELQPSTVCLYDPVFLEEEKSFLRELGLDVLDVNEEAKRTISRKTIFFMPHCDLLLYNNLLFANREEDSLSKLIIIGNSFQNYSLTTPELTLKECATYVYYANKFATEVRVCNSFQFTDIFNDMSVHYFQSKDVPKLHANLVGLEPAGVNRNLCEWIVTTVIIEDS